MYFGDEPNKKATKASEYLKSTGRNRRAPNVIMDSVEERRTVMADRMYASNAHNYKHKTTGISHKLLRQMAAHPLIGAIIQTRQNQVLEFTQVQKDKYSTGLKICFKDGKKVEDATKKEKKQMKFIENFIMNCGRDSDNFNRPNFFDFTKMAIYDSLSLDQLNFEVVWARDKMPHSFYAVDAGTVRRTLTKHDLADDYKIYRHALSPDYKGHETPYVQVYNDQIVSDFYEWELAFGVRNPRTDVHYNGYGVCELEEIVSVVTGLIWSFDYNLNFFKNGTLPKGAWRVSKDFSRHQLNEFKKAARAKAQGVQNAHKDLFIQAEKLEWIDLHKNNRDMEFNEWNNYLVKLACSRYSIDPSEVNFPTQGAAMQSGFEDQNEQKIKHSKDKGLKPLLRFYANLLNRKIVSHFFDGKYELEFAGLDALTKEEEISNLNSQVASYRTLNEVRKEMELPPVPNGDIVLNTTYTGHLAAIAAQEQAEREAQMMAEEEQAIADQEGREAVSEEHMSIVSELVGGDAEAVSNYEEKYQVEGNGSDK